MLIGVTRERTCPACDADVRDRSARWCGRCGAPLGPVAETTAEAPERAHRPRRLLLLLGATVALTLLVVAGGDVIDRVAPPPTDVPDAAVDTPDEDALEDIGGRRPPQPPPTREPTCADVGDDSCFLWTAETQGSAFDTVAPVDGRFVATYEGGPAGILSVRDLRDGRVLWSHELGLSGPSGPPMLTATGQVLLHAEGDALVARELATGDERWRSEELGRVVPWDSRMMGEVLVLAAQRLGETANDGSRESVVAGLDPDTGDVRWREGGRDASLSANDLVVLANFDGSVRAVDATGDLRWQRDGAFDPGSGGVWSFGHIIVIYRDERSETYRLSDGEPLDVEVSPMAFDADHTLVELYEVREGSDLPSSGAVALLDADGVVWRSEVTDDAGCFNGGQLHLRTVELTTCENDQVTLDRADGAIVEHAPASEASSPTTPGGFSSGSIGPYELVNPDASSAGVGDLVITDTRTDTEYARMPPQTWPVGDPRSRGGGADGVVLLQHQRWLAALRVPEGPTAGGGRVR